MGSWSIWSYLVWTGNHVIFRCDITWEISPSDLLTLNEHLPHTLLGVVGHGRQADDHRELLSNNWQTAASASNRQAQRKVRFLGTCLAPVEESLRPKELKRCVPESTHL